MKLANIVTFGAEVMEALGLTKEDTERTRSVKLEHRVGCLPTLTLEMLVPDLAGDFDTKVFGIVARDCCPDYVRNYFVGGGSVGVGVRESHSSTCEALITEIAVVQRLAESEVRECINGTLGAGEPVD